MNITIVLRRRLRLRAAVLALALGLSAGSAATEILVYKTPWCGCCTAWAEHLERSGLSIQIREQRDLRAVKARLGVPVELTSCHTAITPSGLVVEGHVPADIIERLEAQPIDGLVGVAVPQMPPGSPGMEMPNPSPYPVIGFYADGTTAVLERRMGSATPTP